MQWHKLSRDVRHSLAVTVMYMNVILTWSLNKVYIVDVNCNIPRQDVALWVNWQKAWSGYIVL